MKPPQTVRTGPAFPRYSGHSLKLSFETDPGLASLPHEDHKTLIGRGCDAKRVAVPDEMRAFGELSDSGPGMDTFLASASLLSSPFTA